MDLGGKIKEIQLEQNYRNCVQLYFFSSFSRRTIGKRSLYCNHNTCLKVEERDATKRHNSQQQHKTNCCAAFFLRRLANKSKRPWSRLSPCCEIKTTLALNKPGVHIFYIFMYVVFISLIIPRKHSLHILLLSDCTALTLPLTVIKQYFVRVCVQCDRIPQLLLLHTYSIQCLSLLPRPLEYMHLNQNLH